MPPPSPTSPAHALLSPDPWLAEAEPQRLARLQLLARSAANP